MTTDTETTLKNWLYQIYATVTCLLVSLSYCICSREHTGIILANMYYSHSC